MELRVIESQSRPFLDPDVLVEHLEQVLENPVEGVLIQCLVNLPALDAWLAYRGSLKDDDRPLVGRVEILDRLMRLVEANDAIMRVLFFEHEQLDVNKDALYRTHKAQWFSDASLFDFVPIRVQLIMDRVPTIEEYVEATEGDEVSDRERFARLHTAFEEDIELESKDHTESTLDALFFGHLKIALVNPS